MSKWVRPMRWPDAIDGAPRECGQFTHCDDCPPPVGLEARTTIVYYAGRALCLKHALRRAGGR